MTERRITTLREDFVLEIEQRLEKLMSENSWLRYPRHELDKELAKLIKHDIPALIDIIRADEEAIIGVLEALDTTYKIPEFIQAQKTLNLEGIRR